MMRTLTILPKLIRSREIRVKGYLQSLKVSTDGEKVDPCLENSRVKMHNDVGVTIDTSKGILVRTG